MTTDEQIKFMEQMQEFIQHNITIGYVKKEDTVDFLLQYINAVKTNYIPMLQAIEQNCNMSK